MANQRAPAGRFANPTVLAPYVAASLPAEELETRLASVRKDMREHGFSALLVADPENVYYLSGLNHQGYFSFTMLVVAREGTPLIVARAMERPTLAAQVPGCEHVLYGDDEDPAMAAILAIERASSPGETVGVGRGAMFFPVDVWERVHQSLPDREWADASGLIENARAVKSEAEIALIRRAASISDRAVQAGIASAGSDVTERTVAAAVYHEMILAGSEHPGFAPFIRSADILHLEHVTWRDRELSPGSGLLMELSGCVYRYHAPLTRMLYIGHEPPEVEPIARTALDGLEAVFAVLRPGVLTGEVYAAWQEAVDAHLGPRRYRRHHCGYTIGIGFPPSWVGGSSVVGMRPGGKLIVQEHMVFHVLSWILGQGSADFCVSDTVLVTANGCEPLTTTEREPAVVP